MKKIFIVIFVLLSLNSIGQEKWSLEKCINTAYENNIQLKQQMLGVKFAKNNSDKNLLSMLPSLSANASHSFDFGRSKDRNDSFVNSDSQASRFGLNSRLTLFNGFTKLNTLKKGKLVIESKEKDVEKSKSDLAVQIAGFYLQVLFNTEMLSISKEQLKISNEQYTKTSRLVEAGKLAEVELLKQKTLVAQDELAVVEAQNTLDLSYVNLNQVMDIKDEDTFIVSVSKNIIVDANRSIQSSSNFYSKALEIRPEIAKADIEIESSKKDVSIARGGLMPSLTLAAGWNSSYLDSYKENVELDPNKTPVLKTISFSDQFDLNSSKSVSLNLSIPIFNGLQARTSVKNARLQVESTRLEKENKKNILRKEIQQVYANAKASMKKYYSAKLASEYGKQSFEFSQKKYNAGLIDLVSYKEMKKEYVNSLSKLMQSKYDYVFRTKILDYYIGLPINL